MVRAHHLGAVRDRPPPSPISGRAPPGLPEAELAGRDHRRHPAASRAPYPASLHQEWDPLQGQGQREPWCGDHSRLGYLAAGLDREPDGARFRARRRRSRHHQLRRLCLVGLRDDHDRWLRRLRPGDPLRPADRGLPHVPRSERAQRDLSEPGGYLGEAGSEGSKSCPGGHRRTQ